MTPKGGIVLTLQDELALSYYHHVSPLDEERGVWLVRHAQSGRLAVEKHPSVYHLEIYRALMAAPVPHTPRIYAAVENDAGLTVIEEFVSGMPLSVILKDGPLPERAAVDIVRQLCMIVAALHAHTPPIIHRDIKPSNILISDDGVVTLLDFDAAKPYTGKADRDTRLIGTAGYAAPEQYGFAASGPRTDQYAIGVLTAELIHGSFSRAALTQSPCDRVIERCTRMDPADRYPSVTDIVAELSAVFQSPVETHGIPAERSSPPSGRFIPWLPPGFRSLRLWRMLLMGMWYAAAIWIGLTLQVENVSPGALVVHRICATAALLLDTLFLGNYLQIWERLGFTRIRQTRLRLIALIAFAFLLFVLSVFAAVLVSAILGL